MLSALLSRPPFTWLRERDIDLLLCAELHCDLALTSFFKAKVGLPSATFLGAWVSYMETDGESDLIIALSENRQAVLLLVENKISADFQPEQAERYQQRASRWLSEQGIAAVLTILVAPAEYLVRPGVEVFQKHISYEEIAETLTAQSDPRSLFFARALLAGVEAYRRGYVMEPDERVSDMWLAYWRSAQVLAPELRLAPPGLRPGRSTWIYFRDAVGIETDRSNAVVVLKAERGQADLQFADTSPLDLGRRTHGLLDSKMKVVSAKKSAAIRIEVEEVDFHAPPREQEAAIGQGLIACEALRRFFVEHRERLLMQ